MARFGFMSKAAERAEAATRAAADARVQVRIDADHDRPAVWRGR